MAVHQLQIGYDAVPDRLLLRVCTRAGEEYLAHLTRRFVRHLWPALGAALAEASGQPLATDDEKRAAQTRGDFGKRYQVPGEVRHPLGRQPLLVAELRIEKLKDSRLRLVMREHRERSMTLTLDRALLEAFCAMLRASATTAEWDLELAYPGSKATPPSSSPATPKSALH